MTMFHSLVTESHEEDNETDDCRDTKLGIICEEDKDGMVETVVTGEQKTPLETLKVAVFSVTSLNNNIK